MNEVNLYRKEIFIIRRKYKYDLKWIIWKNFFFDQENAYVWNYRNGCNIVIILNSSLKIKSFKVYKDTQIKRYSFIALPYDSHWVEHQFH